ncbi:MAG: MarR family transcriptional regulator [Desulfurococcales archaeon]|jgi:predicted transcriptional regulator|nr:MarR family transcriptional regulator [Desulfurococcales archaeon]MCC6061479.1 MarR family transcriptional regulator [Desulfurococcales archaeon]
MVEKITLDLPRCRLPSGKEVSIIEVLKFFYDFNETDVIILLKILKNHSVTLDDLSRETNLSKASISRSISKLYSLGFVSREKTTGKAVKGRPKYIYRVNRESALNKIYENIEKCSSVAKETFEKLFGSL